jgi:hypothetical protein
MKDVGFYMEELRNLCNEYIRLYNLSAQDATDFLSSIYESLPDAFTYGTVRHCQKYMVMTHHMRVVISSLKLSRKSIMMRAIKD